jgi:6-phosphogluconolactonase
MVTCGKNRTSLDLSISKRPGPKLMRFLLCVVFFSLTAGIASADGAVYAMTNALGNNQILVYHRAANGNLSLIQTIATGGGGSGLQLASVDSLGSAGSVQLDKEHHFLFVVNTETAAANNGAGAYNSDCQQGTITSFSIASDGSLAFADRVFSGGLFPNSLATTTIEFTRPDGTTVKRHLVYVLNAGGPEPPAVCQVTPSTANGPNIVGFRVDKAGHMIPLDSTQPIDPGPAAGTGENCPDAAGFSALTGAPAADFACGLNPPAFPRSPAQVGFSPNNNHLVVTVKGTNTIYVFPVDKTGSAGSPTVTQAQGSALPTYFGFTFDNHRDFLVTETFGSATSIPKGGSGATSSFSITSVGGLVPISSQVGDGGTAACWIALDPITGKFAYVTNNLSASISSYTVGNNGVLTLLNGIAAGVSGPNDVATAQDGGLSFLYVVDAGTGTVGAFQINTTDGSLTPIIGGSGLPFAAQGIAAF